jgi:hypothetical protein
MRDPWATGIEDIAPHHLLEAHGLRVLDPWLERLVFRRTRHVVSNTAELARRLLARFPHMSVTHVPNGIDRERLPAVPATKFEGLSIAYAGSLYLARDLTSVLRAMHAFLLRYPDARSALKLRVAGSMDEVHGRTFWREVTAMDLSDAVDVLGSVSGADAMALVRRSHLSLVLAQHQPSQIPAKLYESVGMGVPTLVITESTSASAQEARRIGAITRDSADVDGIADTIEQLWLKRLPGVPSGAAIGYDHIALRMDAVLRGHVGRGFPSREGRLARVQVASVIAVGDQRRPEERLPLSDVCTVPRQCPEML